PVFAADVGGSSGSPMLPGGMQLPQSLSVAGGASGRFDLARERLRVLSADSPAAARREYRMVRDSAGSLEPAQRYGLAVAQMRDNATAAAIETLSALLAERPGDAWIGLT